MKVRNVLTHEVFNAKLSTDPSASSYAHPVVLVDGEVMDPVGMQIIEASPDEREILPLWWRCDYLAFGL
jgi:hypothetical protein